MTDWDSIVARLAAASVTVDAALTTAKAAKHDERRITSLPATALTEQAIVDALKADPGMAGRVMAFCGFEFSGADTAEFGAAASEHADRLYIGNPRRPGLQSLAVALAAASYRG